MKYAAFDIGEVLVTINLNAFIIEYNKARGPFSINYSDIEPIDFLNSLQSMQDVGLLNIQQALRKAFQYYLSEKDMNSMISGWNDIIETNDEMSVFLEDLKESGVKVALLSNMGSVHASLFRNKYKTIFDGCDLHLSCEVGARKPTKLFYQSFLMDHPEYKGCVYLDDRPENIKMGLHYGFNAKKFELYKFTLLEKYKRAAILKDIKESILA